VPADDPAAVLDALAGMLADPACLPALSRCARERARAFCNADTGALDARIYAIPPR